MGEARRRGTYDQRAQKARDERQIAPRVAPPPIEPRQAHAEQRRRRPLDVDIMTVAAMIAMTTK